MRKLTRSLSISCKVSSPERPDRRHTATWRAKTDQSLHLGLTEAGMGRRPVWSSARDGRASRRRIGTTIRVSLNAAPGGDRRRGGIRGVRAPPVAGLFAAFAPSVTACPGCGPHRTSNVGSRSSPSASRITSAKRMPVWKTRYDGVETMTLAVMGLHRERPGESKAANIGISLPGTGEAPSCPVFIDGQSSRR